MMGAIVNQLEKIERINTRFDCINTTSWLLPLERISDSYKSSHSFYFSENGELIMTGAFCSANYYEKIPFYIIEGKTRECLLEAIEIVRENRLDMISLTFKTADYENR